MSEKKEFIETYIVGAITELEMLSNYAHTT